MIENIYRIRKTSGEEGRPNHYYHADVISDTEESAMAAAEADTVGNWRWIDTFDIAQETYCFYTLLGLVEAELAKNPARPLPKPRVSSLISQPS